MAKHTTTGGKSPEYLDAAVRQIVSKAVASEQVIDLFAATTPQRMSISASVKVVAHNCC
ncbi:MAG: hypothetical protein RH949_05945 [Coleofasciculus sp. A1-SPW-01]